MKKAPGEEEEEEDAADGAEEHETTTKPTTTTTTEATKATKGKKKFRGANASASLLSFEDDGGANEDADDGGASLLKSKAKTAAERRRRRARGIDVSRVVAASERPIGTVSGAHASRRYDAASLRALVSEQATTRDRPEEHAGGERAGRSGGGRVRTKGRGGREGGVEAAAAAERWRRGLWDGDSGRGGDRGGEGEERGGAVEIGGTVGGSGLH